MPLSRATISFGILQVLGYYFKFGGGYFLANRIISGTFPRQISSLLYFILNYDKKSW